MRHVLIMQTALRVLQAVTERRHPKAEDIEKLREIAPESAYLPDDDLACEVIKRELKAREEERQKKAESA